jgi:DNA gyrase subunit A
VPAQEADGIDLIMVSQTGQLLRFPAASVRPQGNTAGGMAGMRLDESDQVLAFGSTHGSDIQLVTITDSGSVKLTPILDYPSKGRGTGGVRCHTFRKEDNSLAAVHVGPGSVGGCDDAGNSVALTLEIGRRDGSGVRAASVPSHLGTTG